MYVQDKANNRVARIRCDVMKTDKVVKIANVSGVQACARSAIRKPGYVFANGEHVIPITKTDSQTDPNKLVGNLPPPLTAKTMEITWQVHDDRYFKWSGNGRWSGEMLLARRRSFKPASMCRALPATSRTRWWCLTSPRLKRASKRRFKEINGVKVVDGRAASAPIELHPLYSVPNSPHGCNTFTPDGNYIMLDGKLSPTVTVLMCTAG